MFRYVEQVSMLTNLKCLNVFPNSLCERRLIFFWSGNSRGSPPDFGRFERVRPVGVVHEDPMPPAHCLRPPYAVGSSCSVPEEPEHKSAAQVQGMRHACRTARRLLQWLKPLVTVGTTTEELNRALWLEVARLEAYPSPLLYCGFPRSVCTSVNDVAVHGIPDARPLHDGDIISVDVSVYINGFHGDCADTWMVGNVDYQGQNLVKAAYKCLYAGISVCKPGVPFADIGSAIEKTAKAEKVTVVPAFLGHGIGSYFHGPPDIYHFDNQMPGYMDSGMTFTIEPVVAQGCEDVLILEDGWTAVMEDGGRAAQAEHTLLITENGYEILTK